MQSVTWADSWQAIGTMISAIASIIAFGILFFQIRQINQTIKSQNHSNIYQIGLQINNLMLENSKLMPYFLGEKELKDGSDEFYKSRLICESLLDYYEYVFLEKSRVDSELLEYYKNYIRIMYNRNILMQKYLSENESTYDSDFVQLIKSKIEK
jgi:hypothetical protein